ncbi:MAG: DMT family transporter [Paracoccaceae bacterium]|nr:DMT family transporter [Paracoccaceae bacterium]MDG1738849.1 DMT family transporter [Paracoccaceae bacterium]MDG2259520.1 DMT family transporter [Paracoccaceae bacterium]
MSPVRGILLKISALAFFTVMAGFAKAAMEVVPAGQTVFFRAFFSLPIVVVWLMMRGQLLTGLRTKRPFMHVSRGLLGGTAMGCNFLALSLLPLPEVTVIGYITPFVTLFLAVVVLGEKVRLFRWSMLGLGLVGVSIVIWPRLAFEGEAASQAAMWGVIFVLISSVLRGVVQIHIRRMVQTENSAAIAFYFLLTVSVVSLLTMPFGWVWPDKMTLLFLIGAGITGGFGQLMITSSFKYAEASALAPFDYITILFSMIIGYYWFGEISTTPMLLGAALVVLSGVLIIWRERQIGVRSRADKNSQVPRV